MPTRETAPAGAPCWIDLMSSDVGRSRDFYTALFGWEAGEQSAEFGGYFMFTRDGVPTAGGMPAPGGSAGDAWSVYLAVDDAARTADAAQEAGAQLLGPVTAVADMGSNGVLADPGGATVGVWQPDTFHGLAVLGEDRAPAWFELHTRDYDRSLDFYRDVFGWNTQVYADADGMRYSVAVGTDGPLAGVLDHTELPDGTPAHWVVYFTVADADATAARVTELGGRVLEAPVDTEFGRIAGVEDPLGAPFRVMTPPATGS